MGKEVTGREGEDPSTIPSDNSNLCLRCQLWNWLHPGRSQSGNLFPVPPILYRTKAEARWCRWPRRTVPEKVQFAGRV